MKNLIKPKALKTGDLVATVSLSWGGASVFPYRYEQSKKQFETAFDVKIVEAPHARASAEMLYQDTLKKKIAEVDMKMETARLEKEYEEKIALINELNTKK